MQRIVRKGYAVSPPFNAPTVLRNVSARVVVTNYFCLLNTCSLQNAFMFILKRIHFTLQGFAHDNKVGTKSESNHRNKTCTLLFNTYCGNTLYKLLKNINWVFATRLHNALMVQRGTQTMYNTFPHASWRTLLHSLTPYLEVKLGCLFTPPARRRTVRARASRRRRQAQPSGTRGSPGPMRWHRAPDGTIRHQLPRPTALSEIEFV